MQILLLHNLALHNVLLFPVHLYRSVFSVYSDAFHMDSFYGSHTVFIGHYELSYNFSLFLLPCSTENGIWAWNNTEKGINNFQFWVKCFFNYVQC